MVDASSAAGGGTVPSVRGLGRVDRRTSARNVGARRIRQELRARTRQGLEPQVDVALALCLVQRSHFLALPFFFAQSRIYVHGVDVRPVILGATCHMGSANYGTPLDTSVNTNWEAQPHSALNQKTCENCTVPNNLA